MEEEKKPRMSALQRNRERLQMELDDEDDFGGASLPGLKRRPAPVETDDDEDAMRQALNRLQKDRDEEDGINQRMMKGKERDVEMAMKIARGEAEDLTEHDLEDDELEDDIPMPRKPSKSIGSNAKRKIDNIHNTKPVRNKPVIEEDDLDGLEDEYDAYEDDEEDEELIDDDDYYEKEPNALQRAFAGLNLSPKAKVIGISVPLAILLIVIIGVGVGGSKDAPQQIPTNEEEIVEEEKGFFAKIFANIGNKNKPINPAGDEPVLTPEEERQQVIDEIIEYITMDYPSYTYTVNDEEETISFVGLTDEGAPHEMVYSMTGELIDETKGNPIGVPGTIGENGEKEVGFYNKLGTLLTEKQVEELNGSYIISYEDFKETNLSKQVQTYNVDVTDREESLTRAIVEVKKLPLRGNVPSVMAKVSETSEEIIFNVSIKDYVKLTDGEKTIIEYTIVNQYGVQMYENIRFVQWK